MISVKNLTFGHTGSVLYEQTSFSVPKNMKAGLVGLNGSGKSTLFNLILGKEYPDDGTVKVEGKVLLVPQEVSCDELLDNSKTVRDYLHLAKNLNDSHLKELLAKMELENLDLQADPSVLSGGQKTKLAILHAVLAEPEVLLLDEPTNFLDTQGKKWVMHWLSQYKRTLVVVSHDLRLLDRAIDKVIYINKQTKKFEEYTGNYSKFKQLKSDRDRFLMRYIRNEEQKITKIKKSIETLKRSHVTKVIHQRIQLEKRLEKMQTNLPQAPEEVVKIKLSLPTPRHIGESVLKVTNLSKAYGEIQVLKNVSFLIQRQQRYALIGRNGTGKSTLIKIILGLIQAGSGTVRLDERAHIGYYSQEFESHDLNQTVYSLVKSQDLLKDSQIRPFLAKFMITGDMLRQQAKLLSGGEKTRLTIALLMLENYNFLILDEPTTYLDVLSQRIILDALKTYQGTMLVVSHTPTFLSELKPDRALLLPEEKVVYWTNDLLDLSSEV